MEDKFQLASSSSMEYEEEEFYEKIEAPKYVDFTLPNHYSPDDCFWFCSRVGCDQKHQEEMDSEAIYKNFVLRVMAARSPNVQFRRAITRKPLSESKKCPFSAPPKTSKARLPKLALVSSSISKKLIYEENGELKVQPAKVKPTTTPKARVKHVAAKYMTSASKKKGKSPDLNAFRSAKNSKKTSVSKALVLNSPKKAFKKKTEEFGTPVSKLCEGVKNLQINSQKKGITRKPSKECTSERKKLALDSSRKIFSSCKGKTREIDAKFCRKQGDVSRLEVEKCVDDCSDMEIDEKSRCGSLEQGAVVMKQRIADNHSILEGFLTLERPMIGMTGESSGAVCSDFQKSEISSGRDSDSSTEEKSIKTEETNVDEHTRELDSVSDRPKTGESSGGVSSNFQKSEISSGRDSDSSTEEKTAETEATNVDEQTRELNPVSEVRDDNDDKENVPSSQKSETKTVQDEGKIQELVVNEKIQEKGKTGASDIENQISGVISEISENQDKENALNFADIRNLNSEILNKHSASVKSKVRAKQSTQKIDKTTKENCPVGTGAQVLKNRKLKTTNPKPFRLRTDERGILKEATSERKANFIENSATTSENSQGTGNGVTEKESKKDESKSLIKEQLRTIKSRPKTSNKVEPKSDKSSRKAKSHFLQDNVVPQREYDSHVKSRGIKTETTMSRSKKSTKQGNEADDPINNKASTVQKLTAQRKITGTIPREPKFQSLHKPKSCTRNNKP